MHVDVQPNYVVDSYTGYTSDSNMIMYDQYVKDNAVQVVQSDVSAEPPTQHVYVTTQTKVVDKSLTVELATYKEQVELYNREVHLDYLKHLKESVATLREIVKEANVERPLDRSVAFACLYTKHSQELLEYMIGTCLTDFNKRDKKQATTPLNRKKQVTFVDQSETSNMKTQKHVEQQITQKTNVLVLPSTRVDSCTYASASKPKGNTKKIGSCQLKVSTRRQKFCDSDLEVAFRKYSCYVHDTDGVELIKGSRGSNLYTILVEDMMKSSLICLLSKASKTKSWLWHRCLNHLNFGTINDLARKDLPMFDEYLEPPLVDRLVSPALAILVPANSAYTPSYTAIDQDAPSPSHSLLYSTLQSPCLHQGIAAESTLMDENPFALVDNDPDSSILPVRKNTRFGRVKE
uniref:Integrase, catalytic region, zinc finger, CCHC-type, peptidase aspartic, catalytic n=1 Tax=Tanacetum cinerariifolium TaxID=118510 RepID=A0A6L2J7S8_TANCI|nr:integrase, catalytic region, zinc finger, CCHC-type, peptidase aspartic, catalytic [Tanacetum cinerariifolium]